MEVTLMGLPEFINDGSYRGVNLLKAPHFRFLNTDKIGYYLFALRTVIQTRPHIVHLQGLGSAIFLVAYRLLGSKVVVRYGSADYVLEKWGIIGKIGFLISEFQLRFAHAVISVTPALTDRLRSRGIVGNVYTIPNALDFTKELTNDSRKANLIVAVGRVTYQKNINTLISGFHKSQAFRSGARLIIVGGLDDVSYVESLEIKKQTSVSFTGRVPRTEVSNILCTCSLYMNLSHHEGSSNATLEAISAGVPIVLSDIPENRDMGLAENIYVDRLNPEIISERIDEALNAPERFIVDKDEFLSWRDVAEKTLSIYNKILGHYI